MKNSVSVCLSIYNQENIINQVVAGIINNASENVKELIICFDGVTDFSEQIVKSTLQDMQCKIPVEFLYADNVWETKANNLTFKAAKSDYILTIQDDVAITELNFDQRMMIPFNKMNNLLGVTGRNAQDEVIYDGGLRHINGIGADFNTPRNILGVRDCIVRGPIMFDHKKLEELGYLDELFAPLYADDYDLSYRAYRKGWLVGSFRCEYYSPVAWGKIRQHNSEQTMIFQNSVEKNERMIEQRYYDLLIAEKHDQDIICE